MSIRIVSDVLEFSNSKYGSRLVLLSMAEFCDDEGICWPKIAQIARRTRMCERAVQYALRSLERSGELNTIRGGNGAGDRGEYHIHIGREGSKSCTLCAHVRVQYSTQEGCNIRQKTAPHLLNEPSVNQPSLVPPLPPQSLAKLASPPRSAQESHEPEIIPSAPSGADRALATQSATGDDPGQNGADGPGRITASAREPVNLERGVRREAVKSEESSAIRCVGNGTPLTGTGSTPVSASAGEASGLPCADGSRSAQVNPEPPGVPMTPMQEREARLNLADRRKAEKQRRRWPQRVRPVHQDATEPRTTSWSTPKPPERAERPASPLLAKLREIAQVVGCPLRGNGIPDWMLEELGAWWLRGRQGLEERATAIFREAKDAGLGFGEAIRSLHVTEREHTKAKPTRKRSAVLDILLATQQKRAAREAARCR